MASLLIKIFLVLLVSVKLIAFHQTDYTVKHHRVEITDYNKDYIANPRIVLYWYNRTSKVFNISGYLKQDTGFKDRINVTVFKFINNLYRPYPIEFKENPCHLLETNVFGAQDVARLLNITKCPIRKGYYGLDNFLPDVSKFPPHLIPFGNYKICVSFYELGIFLVSGCWQGEVVSLRP